MGYTKLISMGDAFEVGGTITWNIGLTTVASNKDLGTITLPTITGQLKYVFIDLIVMNYDNSNALLNYVLACDLVVDYHGVQLIALSLPDGSYYANAALQNYQWAGVRIYGNTDVKSKFSLGSSTHLGITSMASHHDFMNLHGVQPIARVVLE